MTIQFYLIRLFQNIMEIQKKKQYKKGFVHSQNNYQLVCEFQPEQQKLSLVMFIENAHNSHQKSNHTSSLSSFSSSYYFVKIYSKDQNIYQNDPFSMIFQTLQQLYIQLLKNKEQNTLNLFQGYIQIQLQLFNKKVKRNLQLQKATHTKIQKYIIKTKRILQKKLKEETTSTYRLNQKLQKLSEQFQIIEEQYQQKLIKKDMELAQLKLQLQNVQKMLNQSQHTCLELKKDYQIKLGELKNQIQEQQQEQQHTKYNKHKISSVKEDNALEQSQKQQIEQQEDQQKQDYMQNKSKQHIKQRKILQKIVTVRESSSYSQSEQQQSIKQEGQFQIHSFLNKYLQEQMRPLRRQIRGKSGQLKLNFSGQFTQISMDLCKNIQVIPKILNILKQMNFTRLVSLNLDKNNMSDDGWGILMMINMPKLIQLSVSNNNLKNISFNSCIANLTNFYLADSRRTGLYSNMLSQQTLTNMLNYKWINLKALSIDFKTYENYEQTVLKQNLVMWNRLMQDKFESFPKLVNLYHGKCYIQNSTVQNLAKLCKKLPNRTIHLFNRYKSIT